MPNLRSNLIRLASTMGRGTAERKALLKVLASDNELSAVNKARSGVKRGHWADAMKALEEMRRTWRKDQDLSKVIAEFMYVADEAAYDDTGKYAKAALKLLDRIENAFEAGYPSMEGVRALKR